MIHSRGEPMHGPRDVPQPHQPSERKPVGYFVAPEYESDLARFLAETKRVCRERALATVPEPGVPPARERA
jgi:hypothetical protein